MVGERVKAGLVLGAWLCAATAAVSAAPESASLADIHALVRGGASNLALRLLERDAPSTHNMAAWMAWEKERTAVYMTQRNWDAVSRSVERLPDAVPASFRRWALEQAALARLGAKDPAGARRYLRRLIWQETGTNEDLAYWRRLVIRSYLVNGDLDDAQYALQRYLLDNNAKSDVWRVLHAEILLRAGRNRAAFDVLAGAESFEARQFRLLSGLRAGVLRASDVAAQAKRLSGELRARPTQARDAWALMAEAASRGRDLGARVVALEQALALPPPTDSLTPVTADDLWQAYDRLAESVGNAEHLMIGNDCRWFSRAKASLESAEAKPANAGRRPRKSKTAVEPAYVGRALMAFLTTQAADADVREAAHEWLADALFSAGQGEIARALYTTSTRFGSFDSIPGTVRYLLADKALAEYDIDLAAKLIKGLDNPPEGEDKELWSLRRARVWVYAGDYHAAETLLGGLIAAHDELDPDFADRILQVVFDLQAAGRHNEALALLESIFTRADNERVRREILYWRADSRAALGQHERAAELYLASASYGRSSAGDPWGQTARFHAAEELGKGGLIEDARNVYRKLLAATDDPRRRAVIERQIEQLWLVRKTSAAPSLTDHERDGR
jgi:tetratricopeptide (TPR) repeat protein